MGGNRSIVIWAIMALVKWAGITIPQPIWIILIALGAFSPSSGYSRYSGCWRENLDEIAHSAALELAHRCGVAQPDLDMAEVIVLQAIRDGQKLPRPGPQPRNIQIEIMCRNE